MSDYVKINILPNVIKLQFGALIDTDNVVTSISLSDIKSVSKSKEGVIIVTLRDERTWLVSCLSEYIQDTFPIELWNEENVLTNNELFNKIENLII
jgi:hypothetical protein